jgi:hypothetical protein
MRKNISSNPAKAAALRGQLGITAKQLLNRLDNFWQANKKAIDPQYNQRLQAISLSSPLPSMPWFSCAQPVPFQSASDAYFTAMYDAGKFITIGYVGAASREPTSYEPAIVMHGSSILAAAAYCERQGAFNGVSFSMVVPIKLVCLLSPSEEQRALARNVLLKWGEERGLADLCQVAAPSYLDRTHG